MWIVRNKLPFGTDKLEDIGLQLDSEGQYGSRRMRG